MSDSNLKAFIADLSPQTHELVLALRSVIRRIVPEAEESFMWGCISYHQPEVGGRVKGAVCQIVVKRGQVRLDFTHGIRLRDPAGLLQGDGKSKRYVPIETIATVQRPEFAALIGEAAELDWD
jgi:hypothetical protein